MSDKFVKKIILVLEDGKTFRGFSFGAEAETFGEMVFNTSMTGYQEILTDPSYAGQIVCMTYPLIGNYGINSSDIESSRPWLEGFVVREASQLGSNWRSTETFGAYLKRYAIPCIEGIDTRALVRHIRDKGVMRAGISSLNLDERRLLKKVLQSPKMKNRELASKVTTNKPYEVQPETDEIFHIVCYDFGVKNNSLRRLAESGCRVTVVPCETTANEVLELKPDGVFLSNGPGDPSSMEKTVEEIRALAERNIPMFGICLGHQILGQAFGGKTYKLKFGHRGGNQPIKDLRTGKIEITSHNHGFAIDGDSLPENVQITHMNLNDKTVAGIKHRKSPIFSVQYHPEAAPGPHDAAHHFNRFFELMKHKTKFQSIQNH